MNETFIRAALGNPTNEQIVAGAKEAAKILKDKFGDSAVQRQPLPFLFIFC